jgi:ATP/maltotriose-dependent transcriptional regulator MalT
MPDPTMETKLLLPRARVRTVARPRLDLSGRGSEAKLTLVSAPAGFGKTTLLSSWLSVGSDQPTAWVSLDERDRDPGVFWNYLLLAVERAVPGTASAALDQL